MSQSPCVRVQPCYEPREPSPWPAPARFVSWDSGGFEPWRVPSQRAPMSDHILIGGTGRTGTTLLVQVLTVLGFDTGYSEQQVLRDVDDISHAGLEHASLGEPDLPQVIKSPWLSDQIEDALDRGVVKDYQQGVQASGAARKPKYKLMLDPARRSILIDATLAERRSLRSAHVREQAAPGKAHRETRR